MLRYHVAFYLPHAPGEMVVAEALDSLLEEGKALPVPSDDVHSPDADLIELVRSPSTQGPLRSEAARIAGFTSGVTDALLLDEVVVIRSSRTRRRAQKLRWRAMPKFTIASLARSAINSAFRG